MRSLVRLLALFVMVLGTALPAQAAVTITFWSHELGNSFPHAFFTLRGVPEAGGAPVDVNYGFTAKSLTPAILFGPVAGRLDIATPHYIDGSDAQFSLEITDAQYAAVLAMIDEWSGTAARSEYRMNDRNCISFVREAARRVGLTGLDQPKLMKKPRSFLQAVAAANGGHVTLIDQHGKAYLASLAPVAPVTPPPVVRTVTTTAAVAR